MVVGSHLNWANNADVMGGTRRYIGGGGKRRGLCMCVMAMTITAPHRVHNAINFVHIL